jgi:hypothetical protein
MNKGLARLGRGLFSSENVRRGWESNPLVEVLQTSAFPLGYPAARDVRGIGVVELSEIVNRFVTMGMRNGGKKAQKAQRGLWPQSKGIKNAEVAETQRSRSRHEIYAAAGRRCSRFGGAHARATIGRLGWDGMTADSTWRSWRPLRRAQGLELVETVWRENNSTGTMRAGRWVSG